ncbi:pyrroloquinoline quinone biosynthesis protein PqqF [Pseudomonas sp. TTU2014-080ASC]|uniref:pyrroloquinoline quinone biosynthesis protein PqqF n=1 Tax=Pseudomonas sp. TTU2014-080ASC TaxID=1729724 RepID=UPI000718505B|nr:pyrroloquinoline quinone biosynthesis protein PqqF [Pseudomonas sp. TTU2014-080ASC]KRW61970.1 hypothetical protein AO726_00625 [Pseudomonas sp. TTU2014-080ASC]
MTALLTATGASAHADVRILPNGLSVSLLSQPWLKRAGVCVRVAAGSHDEPLGYPGLAHFLEHMLFLDSARFCGDQRLMPYVQACGGQVNATTQARHTEFFFEVPAAQLEGGLLRLFDMLVHPLLSEVEQEREREVVHAEFEARNQDAETLLGCAFGQAMAAGHRCADFVAGNRETLPVGVPAFQQALRSWHQRFYFGGNCQLSIVGPQPLEWLWAVAQQMGSVMPECTLEDAAVPVSLLPLRFQSARMQLPAGQESGVHLGFALELATGKSADALDLLSACLMDEQVGSFAAQLRQSEGCQGIYVRPVYAEAEQAVLVVSLHGVSNGARMLRLLNDWLGFVEKHADVQQLLFNHQQVKSWQETSNAPLQLARALAASAAGIAEPCDESVVKGLIRQMQDVQRYVVIRTQVEDSPVWPGTGFVLRMQKQPPEPEGKVSTGWCVPGSNPLLTQVTRRPGLPIPARLRWMPEPVNSHPRPVAQGVWLARLSFAAPLGSGRLRQLVRVCSQKVVKQAAQLGFRVQIDCTAASLELRIDGPACLITRVIGALMERLANPDILCWKAAFEGSSGFSGMPIRALLLQCNEMLEPTATADEGIAHLRERYATMHVEALGIGFSAEDQLAVASLFASSDAVRPAECRGLDHAVTVWKKISAEGEAALLLFCPQPDSAPLTEASWRLLAHLHQSGFYQRIRSELQLGYAVFCQYRQIQGRRGLLFGVQSPHLSASAILEHIQAFLLSRTGWLESLSEQEVSRACEALIHQLQLEAASVDGLAQQCWQAQLAGLESSHLERVTAHLHCLTPELACAAQRALASGDGGRFVLSNHEQSA